jgi:hypothetical protein
MRKQTLDDLNEAYGFKVGDYPINGIHPTHKKWLDAVWEIDAVSNLVKEEKISKGKAHELISAIIESHSTKK